MPPTKSSLSSKRGVPKAKGAVRAKSGCYTCRIRRKKCDEQVDAQDRCTTCVRLKIQCLGFGAKRPEWLKDSKEAREKIKDFLAKQGMIKGHSGSTRSYEGDQVLHLAPDGYSDAGTPPTPVLSLSSDLADHQYHNLSSMRDDHEPTWDALVGYGQASSRVQPGSFRDDSPVSSRSHYDPQYQISHVDTHTHLSPAIASSFSRLSNFHLSDEFCFESLPPASSFSFFRNPSPCGTADDFVDAMVEHYNETVVSIQYLLAGNDVREFIRDTVTSHRRSRHAATLLASVHYQRFLNPTVVAFDTQETQARMSELWSLLEAQGLASGDAMAALYVVSSYLFDGGTGQWEKWIHVSHPYVQQLFAKFKGHTETLINCSPKDAFIIKTSLWFDVLASVTTQTKPRYLDEIRALFAPDRSRIFEYSSSDQTSMMSPMGCRNDVLWALAETSNLSVWKKEQLDKGSLSMPTLIKYGMPIDDVLAPPSVEPCASADIHGCRTLASELFRSSARIYLQAVLSGDYPHVPEIVASVEDTIDCMTRLFRPAEPVMNGQIMTRSVVRNTVFSFFICGAFAEKEEHRNVIRTLLTQEDVGTGNCGSIHKSLERLWEDRNQARGHSPVQAVDWRSLLLQNKLLLV